MKQSASQFEESDKEAIEIRLSDIWIFLRQSRRAMLIGALVGGLLGGVYAFLQSNQYTSQVTVMPELQSKGSGNLGNLSSLAGLAGINLESIGNNSDIIRPDLYPTVAQSIPFALYSLNQAINSREFVKTQSLKNYLRDHRATTFGGWVSNILPSGNTLGNNSESTGTKTQDVVQLSKIEEDEVNYLLQQVGVVYDKKTGIITITATMPDPVVAAAVARNTLNYLTNYITGYRTEKARKEVVFLTNQVKTIHKRYQIAEFNLASYRDKNRNQYLNTAKIEEQRIQAEFLLAQDLYNSLSKQLELSKIKIEEQTPVFKVLNPAQVPLRKSKPKRILIIAGAGLAGLLLSLGVVFFRSIILKGVY